VFCQNRRPVRLSSRRSGIESGVSLFRRVPDSWRTIGAVHGCGSGIDLAAVGQRGSCLTAATFQTEINMHQDSARALYEFTKSYVPDRGVRAVHDVALALVGQPPDKIDEGVETMLRMLVEGLLGQPSPPSQPFVDGIVVVCREMIRERITELQSSGSGQA